ncbi:hypothetical protein J7L01_00105, partial [bacterium]|nr:hypothetical protein [bacterium]
MNAKMRIRLSFAVLLFALFANGAFGITYLHILVDSVETDTLVQGVPYAFEMDCAPLDTVWMAVIPDLNGNGVVDSGELSVVPDNVYIIDNGEPPLDGPPFFDSDSAGGFIYVDMFVNMWPRDWIVCFSEDSDTIYQPVVILPPDPLLYSVSGRLTLEGTTPPDTILS